MAHKYLFIILFGFILVGYFTAPVPHCKFVGEIPIQEEIITDEEAEAIKSIEKIRLNVRGTSMLPTIQNNSQCLCVKKDYYLVGDIIMFSVKVNEKWVSVSHRIFYISQDNEIYTKGDGNDFIDSPIKEENIICAIPKISRWMTFITPRYP